MSKRYNNVLKKGKKGVFPKGEKFVIIKDHSEKYYKTWNREGLVAYIPKSCCEKRDDNKVYLTTEAKKWFKPKWREDK